jgi:hypothetical protein
MTAYLTCETVIAGTSAAVASNPREIELGEGCMFMMGVLLGFEESSAIHEF